MSMFGYTTLGFGSGGSPVYESFITILTDLGLTTGLKLCLDAGDAVSYTSGQDWVDRSGNLGSDEFHRGAGSGSGSDDPTFNGVAGGLTKNEYFSFDGGDIFRYGSSNETWMNTLHKNGAEFTYMAWTNGNNWQGQWGQSGNIYGQIGVNLRGSEPHWQVRASTGPTVSHQGQGGYQGSGWNLVGLTIDENGGASASFMYENGNYHQAGLLGSGAYTNNTWDGNYPSPSGSNSTFVMEIGARGNANAPAVSGFKMAGFFFWQGTVLSKADMDSFYTSSRTRFGV